MKPIPQKNVVWGNRSIHQVSDIVSKQRMKMFTPPTVYIGMADYMSTHDRFIYTDPTTFQLVVKRRPINIFQVH